MSKIYQNFYELFEIPENATRKEIIQAYQRVKSVYSNDSMALYTLYSNEDSNNIINDIEEAYKILTNPEKREAYDLQNSLNQSKAVVRVSYDKPGFMKRTLLDVPGFLNEDINVVGSKKNILKKQDKELNTPILKIETPSYDQNKDFENKIANELEFSGSFLKEVREYKNITINYIGNKTKISSFYIKAIEEENYKDFPARVYVLGFLKLYTKIIGLEPEKVINSYMKRYDECFK